MNNNMQNVSNEKLIEQLRNGNDLAWQTLCSNNEVLIKKIAKKKAKSINHYPLNDDDELIRELCQAGWLGFVDAIKHYDIHKAKDNKFTTYAAKWIDGEMSKALDDYLNHIGVTGRMKYKQLIQSVGLDSLIQEQSSLQMYSDGDKSYFDYDSFVQELKEDLNCTDQGSYNQIAKACQIMEVLKMMTDENHTIKKYQLARMLQIYRMAKERNYTKLEGDNVIGPAVQKLLQTVNPLIYTGDNDKEYLIKYTGYQENRILKNMNHKKSSGQQKETITDLYYNHPFSTEELDIIIALIAFSDTLSEDEKFNLIEKVRGTASIYYKTPFVNDSLGKINYNEKKIADRFTSGFNSVRTNVSHNLKILQDAINHLVQVTFHFGKYNEEREFECVSNYKHTVSPYHIVVYHDQYYLIGIKQNDNRVWHYRVDLMMDVEILKNDKGQTVPIEIKKKDALPSGIRMDEWNPAKYLSEHLYMSYYEPKEIKIKIRNTDYTILHDWFGKNYRKNHEKCEYGYDIVIVKTSPTMIVHWAMQYANRVEVLNSDIREKIREEINMLNMKYEKD